MTFAIWVLRKHFSADLSPATTIYLDNLIERGSVRLELSRRLYHISLLSPIHVSPAQYYKLIEIQIKTCKSNGIDCKVHGLSVIGRIKSDETELQALNYTFLASDDEEVRDIDAYCCIMSFRE